MVNKHRNRRARDNCPYCGKLVLGKFDLTESSALDRHLRKCKVKRAAEAKQEDHAL